MWKWSVTIIQRYPGFQMSRYRSIKKYYLIFRHSISGLLWYPGSFISGYRSTARALLNIWTLNIRTTSISGHSISRLLRYLEMLWYPDTWYSKFWTPVIEHYPITGVPLYWWCHWWLLVTAVAATTTAAFAATTTSTISPTLPRFVKNVLLKWLWWWWCSWLNIK